MKNLSKKWDSLPRNDELKVKSAPPLPSRNSLASFSFTIRDTSVRHPSRILSVIFASFEDDPFPKEKQQQHILKKFCLWRPNGGRATVPKDAAGEKSRWTVPETYHGLHSTYSGHPPAAGNQKQKKRRKEKTNSKPFLEKIKISIPTDKSRLNFEKAFDIKMGKRRRRNKICNLRVGKDRGQLFVGCPWQSMTINWSYSIC